jgi:hypothetical protein
LVDDFSGDLSRAVFVSSPAVYASMFGASYLRVGLRDGQLMMAPALVSKYAPAGMLLLVDPLRIGLAMDAVAVTSTRQGSIEMSDAPSQQSDEASSPQSTGANLVSMFQTNNVGLRASSGGPKRSGRLIRPR